MPLNPTHTSSPMFRAGLPSTSLHKRLVRGISCFLQLLQLSGLICFLNMGKKRGKGSWQIMFVGETLM